jgi:hypothetical protein
MIAEQCRNGRTCVGYDRATRRSGLIPLDGPLCSGCLGRGHADIAALPGDYAALAAQTIPARGAATIGRVSGGDTDAPVPVALGVDAVQRDIVWTLTTWEPPVREAARLAGPPAGRVRDGWAVTTAAQVLAPRVQLLAALPAAWCYADGLDAGPVLRDGVYALDQFRALHERAQRMTGIGRPTRRQAGACSGCGAEALLRDDGSDTVRCNRCGRRWTADDYRNLVELLIVA